MNLNILNNINSPKELKKLNAMYQSDSFQFAVIYGRRRVGKTAYCI